MSVPLHFKYASQACDAVQLDRRLPLASWGARVPVYPALHLKAAGRSAQTLAAGGCWLVTVW
jgi:hypothetical protein